MKKIYQITFTKKDFKGAFSLMEMMVVLLIVSIIAAASAPMVTKKMARNAAGSGDSPVVFTNADTATILTEHFLIGATQNSNDSNGNPYNLFVNGSGGFAGALQTESLRTGAITATGDITAGGDVTADDLTGNRLYVGTIWANGDSQTGINFGSADSTPLNVTVNGNLRANSILTTDDDHNVITLGGASTTVKIPGKLVVTGQAILGDSGYENDRTIVNANDGNGRTLVFIGCDNGDLRGDDSYNKPDNN